MVTLASAPGIGRDLWKGNAPWSFWQLLREQATDADWDAAARQARSCLSGLPLALNGEGPAETVADILGEAQFGPRRWGLSPIRKLYYAVGRPLLPARIRPNLRGPIVARQRKRFPLGWPVEDRFVRFLFEMLGRLLEAKGLSSVPYVHFWPDGHRFAFVLTHDVESARGQEFVREVAALEEGYGFRSSFNFVAHEYPVDHVLLGELRERGFEVGVHGLKHDGKLYSSKETFIEQAKLINDCARSWGTEGFRSPCTHRHPEWMQALDIAYDSSFFDTDPFEPMPGGTMTIWPFTLGRFVELPSTLPQDHTLMVTLGEKSPRLWLEKVAFIARSAGLALLNTHPDYLLVPRHLAIYEAFLREMRERSDYWQALPFEVARWWRRRAGAVAAGNGARPSLANLPEATVAEARRHGQGVELLVR